MEGSEKWLSPSKSTASPKPSSPRENNENDSSQDKMIPQFQNQKKTNAKHFMPPTISAASKAAPPRKKILSERNENSCNSDVQNHKPSTNLDKKKSPRGNLSISHSYRSSSRIVSSYDRASEPDDNWDTDFLDNSSAKAYDPLKNYLSPRPKYLRFNPNRRREIFSRLEKEESSDDSFDFQEVNDDEIRDSSFSPRKEMVVKPENEVNDYDEEEDGEEEEEEEIESRGWRFKGVLKFLLTLIACVLSTSYICTMNSPSRTPTQQQDIWWKVKDGCLMIKRQTLEVIGVKMWENGFLEVEVGDDYDEFEEGGFEGYDNGENEESVEVEIIEGDDVGNSEGVEIDEDENREVEETVNVEAVENDVENLEEVEIDDDKHREIEESIMVEAVDTDVENLEKFDNELVENEIEGSEDKIDNVAEIEGARSGDQFEVKAENFDRLVDARTDESVSAGSSYSALNEDNEEKIESANSEIEFENEGYEQSTAAKTDESENAGKYESEMEIKGSDQLHELELSEKSVSHEISTNSGPEIKNEKVGRKSEAVIGVSVVSLILASLAITVYRLKKKPRIASAEKSEPVLKPHNLAAFEEKRKIEFIARPSLLHSPEEATKKLDNHHICVPTVELIGEIVVGRVSSRRIGKYKPESEESNQNEYSSISSPSYGSFTTDTKILKKEGGQSGECTVEATPVRRSSRLCSRAAATSP